MTKHDHDPDHDRDRDPRPTITATGRSCPRADGGRARRPDGAGDGAQHRRHGVRRRPFGPADAHVQARDGNGTWTFGQKRTVVEDGSRWAVNPTTFKRGYHLLRRRQQGARRAPRCRSASRCPTSRSSPTQGFEWQEQWAVNMKCLSGADAGTEVVYKTSTVGGVQAIAGLIEAVRDRLNGGQHDGKVSPIVHAREGLLPAPPVREDLVPAC